MAKLKFFIAAKKTDTANILVRFTNGRQFDLVAKTQKFINPAYWNKNKGIVRDVVEFKEKENLQKILNELHGFVIKEFDNTPDKGIINKKWLDQTIDRYHNPTKYLQYTKTLFGFIQHFISKSTQRINPRTGNPVCYKMRREYEVTFDYLKEYAKQYGEPDFIDIDMDFYQQFVDFLRSKNLATNTIGKKIQTLKIFLNAATEKGINHCKKYKSRNFVSLSEESDNIYLTKEELKKFYEFDFSDKPSFERIRDLFIVGCWTGLRYSDLDQVSQDNIHGEFIQLRQKKTGKKVVIPIHYTVKAILKKYNGVLPKLISNQKFNEFLRLAASDAEINTIYTMPIMEKGMKVYKKFKKHQLISSHTARRSFCTNAYKDNIPTLAIMAISGHKTEKAFLKYIKADEEEHAEKVLRIWQNKREYIHTV